MVGGDYIEWPASAPSRHRRDGRGASHRFFCAEDDDISIQKVFKNELEAGILVGSMVGQSVQLFGAQVTVDGL